MTIISSMDPPKGWEIVTGTWNTHADRDNFSRFGAYSVKFISSSNATKIRSGFIPVETGVQYVVGAHAYSDDGTAGYYLTMKIEKYNNTDKETPFGTDTHNFQPTASTWEWHSTEYSCVHTGFIRITLEKTTNTHNMWVDRVVAETGPGRLNVQKLNSQGIADSTWDTVEYETALDYGFTKSGVLYVCDVPGYYSITGTAGFDSLDDQTIGAIRLKVDDGSSPFYVYGNRIAVSTAASMDLILTVSHNSIYLGPNWTIEIEVWHDYGSSRNLLYGSSEGMYFSAMRSGRI